MSFSSISPNTLNPVADAQHAPHALLIYVIAMVAIVFWVGFMIYRWYRHRLSYVKQSGHTMEDFAAYRITVKTHGDAISGVSARTYITVHGEKGTSERMMFSHGLPGGSKITKTVIALNVGAVFSIDLGHDETGRWLKWRPIEVIVNNLSDDSVSRFTISATIEGKAIAFKCETCFDLKFFAKYLSQPMNNQDQYQPSWDDFEAN